MPKTYALVGAAGFVAPRHMQAINRTGGTLLAAMDPNDSVGILDKFNRATEFFTERAPFERWLYRNVPDFLVVCTPNHLHETYIRLGLTAGCNVICEKPLALNPENLDQIQKVEKATGRKVYTVLQLRYPIQDAGYDKQFATGRHTVNVRYVTPRGNWYMQSWKGDDEKSGGIVTNIGVHLFDALIFMFGDVVSAVDTTLGLVGSHEARGTLELERANVEWCLSIDPKQKPTRQFFIDDDAGIDLTGGFNEAHTRVYEEILAGRGFGIKDARPAVELCWKLRQL
jgi:UDP-N-acetyl-2-amino-2-deoxyglucuronate dehydrogenase